ncbi:MAG: acyl-CoA reductase [Bacteroidota bacterium]
MEKRLFSNHLKCLREEIVKSEKPRRLEAISRAERENPWFTQENIQRAIAGIETMLAEDDFEKWFSNYSLPATPPRKNVGVVMAGNIPMVGFHDALCVLASGNKLSAKLSSQDKALMSWIFEELREIDTIYEFLIEEIDKVKEVDAVIATGSDNTARYFEYYFKDIPQIIRKNRTSVALLDGNESADDLEKLSDDIFQYFGLGCRNVSKLYVPKDYNLDGLYNAFKKYESCRDFHKYVNNYEYNMAIYLMKRSDIYDLSTVILEKSKQLVSPIAVVYLEEYSALKDVKSELKSKEEKIQCVVGNNPDLCSVKFGQTQSPQLWDYADNVDTMEFLIGLNE